MSYYAYIYQGRLLVRQRHRRPDVPHTSTGRAHPERALRDLRDRLREAITEIQGDLDQLNFLEQEVSRRLDMSEDELLLIELAKRYIERPDRQRLEVLMGHAAPYLQETEQA